MLIYLNFSLSLSNPIQFYLIFISLFLMHSLWVFDRSCLDLLSLFGLLLLLFFCPFFRLIDLDKLCFLFFVDLGFEEWLAAGWYKLTASVFSTERLTCSAWGTSRYPTCLIVLILSIPLQIRTYLDFHYFEYWWLDQEKVCLNVSLRFYFSTLIADALCFPLPQLSMLVDEDLGSQFPHFC